MLTFQANEEKCELFLCVFWFCLQNWISRFWELSENSEEMTRKIDKSLLKYFQKKIWLWIEFIWHFWEYCLFDSVVLWLSEFLGIESYEDKFTSVRVRPQATFCGSCVCVLLGIAVDKTKIPKWFTWYYIFQRKTWN